ncbi:MAG: M1 family metallopeptidase [Nocardioides sp.]
MSRATPRSRRAALLVGLAATLVLGTVVTGAPQGAAVEEPPTRGAAGIGDSYFPLDGNTGYDVRHYAIDNRYHIDSGRLTGTTVLSMVAGRRLSRFNLDLVLGVDDVRIDGAPVRSFVKDGRHELVVTPADVIARGARFRVTVDYHGTPSRARFGREDPWITSERETMATNEPHIAPWWFPANDHPRDQARFDITVSVPAGNQVISNGELVSRMTASAWSTWHWRISEPITTYLAFFAAGRFEMEHGIARGLEFTNAVSQGLRRSDRSSALRLLRRGPGVVRWMERQFGDYPYSSTGGVVTALQSGFALENASRPTYPYLGTGTYAFGVLVHELAHQWFGNSVAVGRWRDIWLNEGFATWVEWRYREAHGGPSAQQTLLKLYARHPAADSFWKVRIGNPGPDRLFDQAVYVRGAMAVQALRHRMGGRELTRLLRTWLERRGGGNARVWQFRSLAENVSGEQLDGFFDGWLSARSKPRRTVSNGLR